jgi:acetyl esterase/lipase
VTLANTNYHPEHLLDRAAMLAFRSMIALQPAADFGPNGRAAFDELMEKTPAADGVNYEAAEVGGVPGWWCRPAEAERGTTILYLHGGAYVVGSALTGLPPVMLHVGEDEVLLDDARRYADLLGKSGSVANLHIWQGMVHVFPANLVLLQAAREALEIIGNFLQHNLGR